MKKAARILFLIFGTIAPILIGLLHTKVHFQELLTPEIFEILSAEVPMNGRPTRLWNAWGLISFMMGGAFIIIGLLNAAAYSGLGKDNFPPISNIIIMMIYLGMVIYSAGTFNALEQFYGSIGGMFFMTIALFLTLKGRKNVS